MTTHTVTTQTPHTPHTPHTPCPPQTTKPLFLGDLLRAADDDSSTWRLLQRRAYRLSRVACIVENQWLCHQSTAVQDEAIVRMALHNVSFQILHGSLIANCVVRLVKVDVQSDAVLGVVRSMCSFTPLVAEMAARVASPMSASARLWFCKLMEHVCTVSLERARNSYNSYTYFRSTQLSHYSKWLDLFAQCVSDDVFSDMCAIHATTMRQMRASDAHYRVRMLRKIHTTMLIDLFYARLLQGEYIKVDLLFVHHVRTLRGPMLKYVSLCDDAHVVHVASKCTHFMAYLRTNLYKLQDVVRPRQVLWAACQSDAEPRMLFVGQLCSVSNAQQLATCLAACSPACMTEDFLYHALHDVAWNEQRQRVSLILQLVCDAGDDPADAGGFGAVARARVLAVLRAFMSKYMRYVLRIVKQDNLRKALRWYAESDSCRNKLATILQSMVLSTSIPYDQRELLIEWIGVGSMHFFVVLLGKLETTLKSQHDGAFPCEQRTLDFYSKQAKLLMHLPLDCALTKKVCQTLLRSVRSIMLQAKSMLLMRWSTSALRHAIMYVLCTALIFSRLDVHNNQICSSDICAICGETLLRNSVGFGESGEDYSDDDRCFTLPCTHTMHANCLCTMVQHTKQSKSMFQCPYCKSEVLTLLHQKMEAVDQSSCGGAADAAIATTDTVDICSEEAISRQIIQFVDACYS
jgi:hypothetical protein